MATSKQPTVAELRRELDTVYREIRELREAYGTAVGLDSIAKGVGEIAELMAPLKSLAPPARGTGLDPRRARSLAMLLRCLRRPEWAGVVSLDVQEPSLTFIGDSDYPDPVPQQQQSERSASQ